MSININVEAGESLLDSNVFVTGQSNHIITGDEQPIFNLATEQLYSAWFVWIEEEWTPTPGLGEVNPILKLQDVFLHEPTKWELYPNEGWDETIVHSVPNDAEVLTIVPTSVAVDSARLSNNSSETIIAHATLSYRKESSATSTWSTEQTLGVDETISFEYKFLGSETTLSYEQTWGESESHTYTDEVITEIGVDVSLTPGQEVIAKLMVIQYEMQIKIKYLSKIEGDSAANFDPEFQGHHFYRLPSNSLPSYIGLSSPLCWTEEIVNVKYASESSVDVIDAKTGRIINRIPYQKKKTRAKAGKSNMKSV